MLLVRAFCLIDDCVEIAEVRMGKRRLTVKCPVAKHGTIMMQDSGAQKFIRNRVKLTENTEIAREPVGGAQVELVREPRLEAAVIDEPPQTDDRWSLYK